MCRRNGCSLWMLGNFRCRWQALSSCRQISTRMHGQTSKFFFLVLQGSICSTVLLFSGQKDETAKHDQLPFGTSQQTFVNNDNVRLSIHAFIHTFFSPFVSCNIYSRLDTLNIFIYKKRVYTLSGYKEKTLFLYIFQLRWLYFIQDNLYCVDISTLYTTIGNCLDGSIKIAGRDIATSNTLLNLCLVGRSKDIVTACGDHLASNSSSRQQNAQQITWQVL